MMIRRRASLLLAAILALGSAATALAPSAFAEGEPNDTLATANTIAVNNIGDTGATINPSNDTDWFKFTVSPGNYTIQAYDVASSLSSGISTTLYSSSGQWIASDTDGSNNVASQISTSISIAGTYYIRVEGESSSQIGTYKLRVLPEAGHGLTWDAESEPDGARALAPEVALGVANAKSRSFAVTSATLVDSDDVDYIRFTAPRAGVYTVQAFDVATTAAPASIDVYDASGNFLENEDAGSANVNRQASVAISIPGTYFARLTPDYSGHAGTYQVRVLPQYDQGLTALRT